MMQGVILSQSLGESESVHDEENEIAAVAATKSMLRMDDIAAYAATISSLRSDFGQDIVPYGV